MLLRDYPCLSRFRNRFTEYVFVPRSEQKLKEYNASVGGAWDLHVNRLNVIISLGPDKFRKLPDGLACCTAPPLTGCFGLSA